MGAWIETQKKAVILHVGEVAPLVGAWIETTVKASASEETAPSHPSWVRGLKLKKLAQKDKEERSHPSWVRGLKLQ